MYRTKLLSHISNLQSLEHFTEASAVGAEPYVKVGDRVNVGDVVCIVEAMKVMNEIKSDKAGVIKEVLAKDGSMVEYDAPLFVIGD